jgi:hypothetical protein
MKHPFLHMETTPNLQQHLGSETKITNGLLVLTRGRATLNYIPKWNPTAQKLLKKLHPIH